MIKKFLNEKNEKLNIKDYITIFIILLIYGILSFMNLGSFENPQSFYSFKNGDVIIFELEKYDDINHMMIFNGYNNSKYQVYTSMDNKDYTYINEIEGSGAFAWDKKELLEKAKYIRFNFLNDSTLGEVAFYNDNGEYINIKSIKNNSKILNKQLYDEKDIITK